MKAIVESMSDSGKYRLRPAEIVRTIHEGERTWFLVRFPGLDRIYVKDSMRVQLIDRSHGGHFGRPNGGGSPGTPVIRTGTCLGDGIDALFASVA